jgi:cell division septum initiation protein DivIVA
MSSSTDSDQVGRTGARFGGTRQRPASERPRFEQVLRGYDRAAVDAFVDRQDTALDGVRADLAEAERARDAATERADAAERENAGLRQAAAEPAPMADTGFGSRAEKILRMAEREASEARARAAAESAALIDAARSSAEAHRHQVEEELIGRVSRAEQTAALLEAELVEREQQMARKLEADREEARRVHDAAVRAAEVLRGAAEAEAQEIRLKARAEVEGMRESARQDLARLSGLRSDVRTDLDRLVRVLETEARAAAAADQSRPAEKVASVSALE